MDNRQRYRIAYEGVLDDGEPVLDNLTIDEVDAILNGELQLGADMNDIEWACQEEGAADFDGFSVYPE